MAVIELEKKLKYVLEGSGSLLEVCLAKRVAQRDLRAVVRLLENMM